jgi:hypothetical protein
MKPWETSIPKQPKNKYVKRCYTIWTYILRPIAGNEIRAGGKVVWLTDTQLTLARIKYPNKDFDLVLERDRLEEFKKYINQTIE